MISLPKVTLLTLDTTSNVMKSILALCWSKRCVEFGAVVCVTDLEANKGIEAKCHRNGIIPVNHKHKPRRLDYEIDQLTRLPEWFDTQFVLFQEHDACVVARAAWRKEFLEYDYIGAPWPEQHNQVGNGGFSIRSKLWCQAVAAQTNVMDPAVKVSDYYACITLGQKLRQNGFKIAPANVAERFSCEHAVYSGQFGYHGALTKKMNGWNFDGTEWMIR